MNRRLIAACVAGALFVLGVWYVGFWSPHTGELARTKTATAAADANYQSLRLSVASLRAQQRALPAREAVLLAAAAAVPSAPQLDQAIDEISAAASAAGVSWQNESQSAPTPSTSASAAPTAGSLTSLKMTLSVSGTYAQTMDFLSALGTMPRLFVSDSVSVGGDLITSLQISGRIFYDSVALPKLKPPASHK